jgi:hypothetical protein
MILLLFQCSSQLIIITLSFLDCFDVLRVSPFSSSFCDKKLQSILNPILFKKNDSFDSSQKILPPKTDDAGVFFSQQQQQQQQQTPSSRHCK